MVVFCASTLMISYPQLLLEDWCFGSLGLGSGPVVRRRVWQSSVGMSRAFSRTYLVAENSTQHVGVEHGPRDRANLLRLRGGEQIAVKRSVFHAGGPHNRLRVELYGPKK